MLFLASASNRRPILSPFRGTIRPNCLRRIAEKHVLFCPTHSFIRLRCLAAHVGRSGASAAEVN